ncbi:MAG TPA: GNAT family N-acetyltransferase [Steroidobacteraceae bacterium]|jgi:GNAT superfamily N-acetyltransferase
MLVRAASISDADGIALLVREYWKFEGIAGFDHERVRGLLVRLLAAPQSGACWVASEDSRYCGYLLAVYVFSLEHGGTMAEIDEFYVSAAERSTGLGAQLLDTAERDMAQLGLVRLQLQLGVENLRGREFYSRHGFEPRAGYTLLDKPL